MQPKNWKESKVREKYRLLTVILKFRRLGELLSKQSTAEICFKSLKFIHKQIDLRLAHSVGSFAGTIPAAKY